MKYTYPNPKAGTLLPSFKVKVGTTGVDIFLVRFKTGGGEDDVLIG